MTSPLALLTAAIVAWLAIGGAGIVRPRNLRVVRFLFVLGALVAVAGFYLFTGSRVAGVVALVFAVLSALANFAFIPYYPIWAILIIAVNVFIIWAIASSSLFEED